MTARALLVMEVSHQEVIMPRMNFQRFLILAIVFFSRFGTCALAEDPTPTTAPALLAERIVPVHREASNRAVRLRVQNAQVTVRYGALPAPEGRRFLVVATEWDNHIPLVRVKDKEVATAYLIPDLRDQIYLVADGRTVLMLAADTETGPGLLPRKDFTIQKPGQTVRGNLLFDLPAGPLPESLELRFYDFAHGHMAVDVLPPPKPPVLAAPLSEPRKNDVIEAAVYGIQRLPKLGDAAAPEGMTFVSVDLRARSTLTIDADATAFDPQAKPGQRTKVGTVADWKESRKYVQLIVDGQYAYPALAASGLVEEPRFLPDLWTGGSAMFLIPGKSESLELRCDFPNAALPDGTLVRPAGLNLAIEGKRPVAQKLPAIAAAKDEIFDVSISGQQTATEFGGTKAEEGQRFLVIDVTVKNVGKKQEFFQPKEQLKFVTEAGEQNEFDESTLHGMHPPSGQIYIPDGERRSFQIAYRIGADETKPRVAYGSVTEGASKVLTLKPLEKI